MKKWQNAPTTALCCKMRQQLHCVAKEQTACVQMDKRFDVKNTICVELVGNKVASKVQQAILLAKVAKFV